MMKLIETKKILSIIVMLMLAMSCSKTESVKMRTNVFVVPNPVYDVLDSMVYVSYPIDKKTVVVEISQFFKKPSPRPVQEMDYSLKWKDGVIYRGQWVNDTIFYQRYIIPESRDTIKFNINYDNQGLYLNIKGKTTVIHRDAVGGKTFFQLFCPYEFEDSLRYMINDSLIIEEVHFLDVQLKLQESRIEDINGEYKKRRKYYSSLPEVFQN